MKFKIDENLPGEFDDVLTHAGYSADTVVQEKLQGADDSAVANICQKESRILLTLDLDFADIRSYPPHEFPGLVVLRPRRQDKLHLIELLQSLIPLFSVGMSEKDAQAGLDILFAYTEREHPFNEREVAALLDGIHTCKILAPACGSGAFPIPRIAPPLTNATPALPH